MKLSKCQFNFDGCLKTSSGECSFCKKHYCKKCIPWGSICEDCDPPYNGYVGSEGVPIFYQETTCEKCGRKTPRGNKEIKLCNKCFFTNT